MWSEKKSVFEEIHALASRHDAVNLGVGTPGTPLPERLQAAAAEAMANGHNQYAPVRGEEVLRVAIAEHALRFYGQKVDPATEISVTSGVTEGMHSAIFAFVEPGDEVIVFEPFYDCYIPNIRAAGGVPVAVPLRAPDFRFDPQGLRGAFSPRTRALIVNTPHNPTGTVFSREELELVAALCHEFDVLAITDEVYEHIVFDGEKHVRLATLPGMWERTLTLSGAGKTFSCTGWRIGWAIGPAALQEPLERLRQFTVFAAPTPFQFAIGEGLPFPDSYFEGLAAEYAARRDYLIEALAACGLSVAKPNGAFFVMADFSRLSSANGRAFCEDLAKNFRVVPTPVDTFYLNGDRGQRFVRFVFSPPWETLRTGVARLSELRERCFVGERL